MIVAGAGGNPKIGSLFTGYGGLDLAAETVFDAETVWTVENDPAASVVTGRRFPDAPNLGDVTRVDWDTVEPVEILTGGFPCQDVSSAGLRGGLRPTNRSGLWANMAAAVAALRPSRVVVENVKGLAYAESDSTVEPCPTCVGVRPDRVMRALGTVLGDLAALGYDAEWVGLRAADVGAPHGRFRLFLVAHPSDPGEVRRGPRGTDDPGQSPRRSSRGQPLRRRDGATSDPGRPGLKRNPERNLAADTDRHSRTRRDNPHRLALDNHRAWGPYADAIDRWERITGRRAPAPTDDGTRLNPRFVEWMMGLEDGWVTGIPFTRADALRILGNGVVPQQATRALRILEDRIAS